MIDGEYFVIFEDIEEFYHLGYIQKERGFSITKAKIKNDNGLSIWIRVNPFKILLSSERKISNIMVADRSLIFKNEEELLMKLFSLCK